MPPKIKTATSFKNRMVALTVFLIVGFILLLVRLAFLQVVQASDYRALAEGQYTLVKRLTPIRGEIQITDKFSTTPYTVATNVERDLLYAVPKAINNPSEVASKIASILEMEEQEIIDKISDQSKNYVPVKKELTEEQVKKIRDLNIKGLSFDPQTIRYYPENSFLSATLGFVGFKGDEKKGLYGLESYFQDELAGKAGSLAQEKDSSGIWIFGTKREITPAINGDSLILTIDRSIQLKTETVLKEAVEHNQADSGSVVVMDPKTGAILAMASYPGFNPNEYGKVENSSVYNNVNTTAYEPGSVFKAITMAASVDKGAVGPNTTYNDTGKVEIDGYTIQNSDKKAHGIQTMTQVLEESLNTGVIFAKDQIGNPPFLSYVQKFGFGKKTGVELPETAGNLANLDGAIKVNYDTAAFGQGILVTPLQLLQAYGSLANKGVMMKPYIVKARVSATNEITETKPEEVNKPVSESTAKTISAMLVNVVENGHGKKAAVKGYYIAGKTGTAQVSKKDSQGYEQNNNIGSFAGYGPVEDPRFVMVVRINHPRTVQFAESTAAPAFGSIAQYILNYYGIQPNRH